MDGQRSSAGIVVFGWVVAVLVVVEGIRSHFLDTSSGGVALLHHHVGSLSSISPLHEEGNVGSRAEQSISTLQLSLRNHCGDTAKSLGGMSWPWKPPSHGNESGAVSPVAIIGFVVGDILVHPILTSGNDSRPSHALDLFLAQVVLHLLGGHVEKRACCEQDSNCCYNDFFMGIHRWGNFYQKILQITKKALSIPKFYNSIYPFHSSADAIR